jgi:hypothetical protein
MLGKRWGHVVDPVFTPVSRRTLASSNRRRSLAGSLGFPGHDCFARKSFAPRLETSTRNCRCSWLKGLTPGCPGDCLVPAGEEIFASKAFDNLASTQAHPVAQIGIVQQVADCVG